MIRTSLGCLSLRIAMLGLLIYPPLLRAEKALDDLTGPWQLFVDDHLLPGACMML